MPPTIGTGLAGPGRPRGNHTYLKAQRQLAQDVIGKPGTPEYLEFVRSCRDQLIKGTLAPAVAVLILQYGYGKVADKIEVKDTTESIENLSITELRQRALELAQEILEAPQQLAIEGEVISDYTS